jgi:hypothetical protein
MIPLVLLIPTYSTALGVDTKTYPAIADGELFYGSFKTYGGTEITVNGIYSIEDTAIIECWYRPDIKSDCRIGVPATGAVYDVEGQPENINMRNQFLRFKVRRYKGGA